MERISDMKFSLNKLKLLIIKLLKRLIRLINKIFHNKIISIKKHY